MILLLISNYLLLVLLVLNQLSMYHNPISFTIYWNIIVSDYLLLHCYLHCYIIIYITALLLLLILYCYNDFDYHRYYTYHNYHYSPLPLVIAQWVVNMIVLILPTHGLLYNNYHYYNYHYYMPRVITIIFVIATSSSSSSYHYYDYYDDYTYNNYHYHWWILHFTPTPGSRASAFFGASLCLTPRRSRRSRGPSWRPSPETGFPGENGGILWDFRGIRWDFYGILRVKVVNIHHFWGLQ